MRGPSAQGHAESEPGHKEAHAALCAITKPPHRNVITFLFPFYGARSLGLPRAMNDANAGHWNLVVCLPGRTLSRRERTMVASKRDATDHAKVGMKVLSRQNARGRWETR
jgi:hypothetical protein